MATYGELKSALVKAHRAGDTAAASLFADKLKGGDYREAQQAQMPTAAESVSGPEAALIGAGRSLTSLGRGIGDLFARGAGLEGMQQNIAAREAEETPLYAELQQERPGATMAGEVAPYLATAPLSMGSGAAGLAAKAGMGALLPALEHGAPTERLQAGAAGAAGGLLGAGIGAGLGRAIRPVGAKASQAVGDLADRAKALGLKTTPAIESGSRPLAVAEASLRSSPFASQPLAAAGRANQQTVNQVAARSIGETAEDLSAETLDRAARRIGQEFEAVADIPTVQLGNSFASQVGQVEADFADAVLQDFARPVVTKAIETAKQVASGSVTGRQALDFTSRLGKQARSLSRGAKSDPEAAFILSGLKDAMDDAVMRSAGPEMAERLTAARQQWRNLIALENPGVISDPITGDVSAATLANVLRRQGGSSFGRGRQQGELAELAAVGKAMRPAIGDSGTASRMAVPMLGLGGTMGALSAGDIEGAAGGAATGLGLAAGLPWLLGKGYASPLMSRYMAQGLAPITEAQRALITGAGRGLGSGLLTRD